MPEENIGMTYALGAITKSLHIPQPAQNFRAETICNREVKQRLPHTHALPELADPACHGLGTAPVIELSLEFEPPSKNTYR